MNQVKLSAPDGSRLKAKASQIQMKLPGSLFDERNQARALLFKGSFVAIRSAIARVMKVNHKLPSLSVMITERHSPGFIHRRWALRASPQALGVIDSRPILR
jgi:hypothetical protein